jgi:hypothetical protein
MDCEIVKVRLNFASLGVIHLDSPISPIYGYVFHVQPAVPSSLAAPIAVLNSQGKPISIRRICVPSGQMNCSLSVPQNSFWSKAKKLVGENHVEDVGAVIEKNGIRTRESHGVYSLAALQKENQPWHVEHFYIAVRDDFDPDNSCDTISIK